MYSAFEQAFIDTLEESNNPCLIIRNARSMSRRKAQLNAIEIHIGDQLTKEQKQILLNAVIDQSCKVNYDDNYSIPSHEETEESNDEKEEVIEKLRFWQKMFFVNTVEPRFTDTRL